MLALRSLCRVLFLVSLVAWVHGCAGGAQGLADIAPDASLTTASVPTETEMTDNERDARLILAQLVDGADATGASWENPATGARGTILDIAEVEHVEASCLAFAVTRESYEGIGVYDGLACQGASGVWDIREFAMRQ